MNGRSILDLHDLSKASLADDLQELKVFDGQRMLLVVNEFKADSYAAMAFRQFMPLKVEIGTVDSTVRGCKAG